MTVPSSVNEAHLSPFTKGLFCFSWHGIRVLILPDKASGCRRSGKENP